MALDSLTLALLAKELQGELEGGRIDKIHQPSKDEVVFHFRKRDGNIKLLVSARSGSSRICVTKENFENPQTPPSFCMLLRKYLSGARFVNVSSIPGERIVTFAFTATSEMGDSVKIEMAVELMGRYANIVIINQDGKIIDAMKRVDADASSLRQLLPGLTYNLPPNKIAPNIIESPADVISKVFEYNGALNTAFLKNCQGIGPVIARELAYLSTADKEVYGDHLDNSQKAGVIKAVEKVVEYWNNPIYTTVFDQENRPCEFSFMPLNQYEGLVQKQYPTINDLLEEYYSQKDKAERIRQKGKDLYRLTQNLLERTQRKQVARHEELKESVDSEKYRIYGELLTANLYKVQKGAKSVIVENYYDGSEIEISLDVKLTANQNAQKYYKEYKRCQTAVKMLTQLLVQGENELEYLKSIAYSISKAEGENELTVLRSELHGAGYIKYFKSKDKKQKPQDFIRYESIDGFLILVGRNNLQNDKLTMKTARGRDLWFHTKNAPGSHVIVFSEGAEIPNDTKNQAAQLALYYSSQSGGSKVSIDYTEVKNIKKTNDLKPGMVIYDNYETAYITYDEEIMKNIKKI